MLALSDAYCPWIRNCGQQLRPKPWSYPMRVLSDYLLIYVSQGHEWITVEGEHHDLEAGSVYLIQPGRLSDKGSHSWSHPYWIHFDLMYQRDRELVPRAPMNCKHLDKALKKYLQADTQSVYGENFPLLMPEPLLPRFREDIPRIIELWISSNPVKRLQAPQLLHQLMNLCLAQISNKTTTSDNLTQIEQAEFIARSSLESDFGVAAFAAAAGLSPSRFHECYKTIRGITPLRFLTDMRMQRARELLTDQSLAIGDIASLVGHPDPTVFGRIFKREHGMTPRAYREHISS